MRHCLDAIPGGRWIQVADGGLEYLRDLDCDWPGNVRNLEQLATRLVVENEPGLVTRQAIEALIAPALARTPGEHGAGDFEPNWKAFFAKQEKLWLQRALRLKKDRGLTNAELAQLLGIGEAKLYRKLSEYGLRSTDEGAAS
jgi:DNA-binding NtrC family response regulator